MTDNSLPFNIALRYIRGKRGSGFASFISWMSFIAMTLGVMSLIVVMSVMNGFNQEITGRILRVVPHATVTFAEPDMEWKLAVEQLSNTEGVVAASPFLDGYGMLSYSGNNKGVQVQGIAPQYEIQTTALHEHMLLGQLVDLQAGEFGIVLGDILARSLGVVRGDRVLLSLPQLNVTPVGIFPRFKRFTVVGVYSVGAQVDDGIAFIHYRDAQKIYRMGTQVKGVRLKVVEPLEAALLSDQIMRTSDQKFEVESWDQNMASLFDAIKMEKLVVGTLLSSIIAVAAFNIIASLVLMVADKRKDLAVLRTLGADQQFIRRLVAYQGSVIGLAGVLMGTFLGSLIAVYIGDIVNFFERLLGFYVFDPQVYFIQQLPSQLMPSDIAVVAFMGIILSIVASLYPAWRAGKILPAEALRYDH